MWPLGSYDRMVFEIKHREDTNKAVIFGVLIADYRQRENREYILNYISRFNYKSGKYIDFYLPGYLEEDFNGTKSILELHNKKYFFDPPIYDEFLEKLGYDFDIDYPYTPILVLVEYKRGLFSASRKIVIDLDSDNVNIKRTGELIEKIIYFAKNKNDLKEISRTLIIDEVRSGFLDTLVNFLDNNFISAVYDQSGIIKKYKII